MAMIATYFDESGTPDDCAVVVSGFVGTVEQWVRFEADWKSAHADYGLPDPAEHPFHMIDFAHSNGVFHSWRGDDSRRKHFMRRLITVIQCRVEFGFSCVIEMDTYRAANQTFNLEPFAPYALAASAVLWKSVRWAEERQHEIKHVFADKARHKGRFLDLLDGKPGTKHYPSFGTTKDYLPCQAADLSAYEWLNFTRNRDDLAAGRKDLRRSALALLDAIPGQYMSADKAALLELCEMAGVSKRDIT